MFRILNRWLSNRSILIGVLITAGSFIVGSSVFSLLATKSFTQLASKANLAKQTLVAHQKLLLKLEEASTAQRNYLLSVDPRYSKEWQLALEQIPNLLESIQSLSNDNPTLIRAIKEVRRPIELWQKEKYREMLIRQTEGLQAVSAKIINSSSEKLLNEIRQQLILVEKESVRLNESATRQSGWTLFRLQLMGVLFTWLDLLMLGVGGYYLVSRLRDLEQIITVCAWTKRVKHEGQWLTFEAYMKKRFGIKISHGISEDAAEQWVANTPPSDTKKA